MSSPFFPKWLRQAADPRPLSVFRICWGIVLLLECKTLVHFLGEVHNPDFFHYYFPGFSWVGLPPAPFLVEIEILTLALATLAITAGVWTRGAAIVFVIGYGHLFFAEAAKFNNHFYLVLLVTLLLSATKTDSFYTIGHHFSKDRQETKSSVSIPFWNYSIFRFQVVVMYLFGAIAKIRVDWLIEREPVRFWMEHSPNIRWPLSSFAHQEWFVATVAWGGFCIDLLCPILLLFRRTRISAFVVLALFHLLNMQMFQIGNFPLMGIALLVLFFPVRGNSDSNWLMRFFAKRQVEIGHTHPPPRLLLRYSIYCYLLFQVLFPLRWVYFLPRDPLWSEYGQKFSWMMMVMEKNAVVSFHYDFPEDRPEPSLHSDNYPKISSYAAMVAFENPAMIWQYAQEQGKRFKTNGYDDVPIYVHACASLNGGPYFPIIDPNVDLTKVDLPLFSVPDWIPEPPPYRGKRRYLLSPDKLEQASKNALLDWFAENPGPGQKFIQEE